jgi:hypothetical protein
MVLGRVVLGLCLVTALTGRASAADWPPITPADLALKAPRLDPAADAEALLWDVRITDASKSDQFSTVFQHHLRIKIFSDRGRERYASVELPYTSYRRVRDIEGRTVAPDGTITELRGRDVFDRTIVEAAGQKIKARTFVLPAVTPGAIIDYRWTEIEDDLLANNLELVLQREIPTHVVHYHIKALPLREFGLQMSTAAFNLTTAPTVVQESQGYAGVILKDIPALRSEPYMPPDLAVKPWLLMQYVDVAAAQKPEAEFWRGFATNLHASAKPALASTSEVTQAVRDLKGAAATVTPEAIVRYVRERIARTDTDTAPASLKPRDNKSGGEALKTRVGRRNDLAFAMVAIAREAGLDATIAMLPDRQHFFSTTSLKQPYFLKRMLPAVKTAQGWRFFDPGNEYARDGHLAWEQEGQYAIVITEKGAEMVRVPSSPAALSVKRRSATLTLAESGDLEGSATLSYTGHLAVQYRERDDDEAPAERERFWKEEFARMWPGATVTTLTLEAAADPQAPYVVKATLTLPGFAQQTGSRVFVQPALMQRGATALFANATRVHRVVFPFAWREEDDVTIRLPAGHDAELPAKPAVLGQPGTALSYSGEASFDAAQTALVWRRTLEVGAQGGIVFEPASYAALKAFFDTVLRADQVTIPLRRKDAPHD